MVRFVAELLERLERYFASAPELIVMPAALSSALKVLTLTPRFSRRATLPGAPPSERSACQRGSLVGDFLSGP